MKNVIAATAFAALLVAVPAIAAENSSDNMPPSSTSSGPNVKGAPGGKSGPTADPNATNPSGSGSSTGEQGMSPSQDATGVSGARDSTNGPSNKKPDDSSK